MELFLRGLSQVANVSTILWMAIGSILGVIIGALPGLTATMGVALMMPISFHHRLSPVSECCWLSTAGLLRVPRFLQFSWEFQESKCDRHYRRWASYDKAWVGRTSAWGAAIASFIGGIGSLVFLVLFAPMIAK